MEYNSAMKNNEILPFAAKQTDVEIIIQSQTMNCMVSLTCGILKIAQINLFTKQKKIYNKLTVTKEKRDTRNKFLVNHFKI